MISFTDVTKRHPDGTLAANGLSQDTRSGELTCSTTNAATPRVTRALGTISAQLTTEKPKNMVKCVEVDQDDTANVAVDFLPAHYLELVRWQTRGPPGASLRTRRSGHRRTVNSVTD